MKIVDESMLDRFRGAGKCENCGKNCRRREPHHVFCRGIGGGGQMDIACNLIALGSSLSFECACHVSIHAGNGPSRDKLLDMIGKREGETPEDITDCIYFIARLPKDASSERIARMLDELSETAGKLVVKTLKRAGKIAE